MFAFLKKRTQYKAGGLKPSRPMYGNPYKVPLGWDYPAYIDGRPYLLPSDDQGQTSRCFPGKSLVLMENLQWRNISDIRPQERVIGADGAPHTVTHISQRPWQGNIHCVSLIGADAPLRATAEHPVLIIAPGKRERAKPAQELRLPEWKPISEVTRGCYVATIGTNCRTMDSEHFGFETDPEFLWAVGLYLAEGVCGKNAQHTAITFCLCTDEDAFVQRLICLADRYGWKHNTSRDAQHHSQKVCISSSVWHAWLSENCGHYSHGKRLSDRVMLWPACKLGHIFTGWMDGDGHRRGNRAVGTTVSAVLARQLKLVALKCGIPAGLRARKPRTGRQQAWDVSCCIDQAAPTIRGFWHEGLYYTKVISTNIEHAYTGSYVYNLTVAGVQSYVVDYSVVHNCAAYATSGIQEAMNWWKTGKRASVDPQPLYDEAKRLDGEPGKDNGTTLEQIIKAALNLDLLVDTEIFDIKNGLEFRYAMHKLPLVLLGLNITEGWNNAGKDGIIPTGGNTLGGHAVVGCYYDQDGIWITNSWGPTWGKDGRGFITWRQFNDQFMGAKGFSRANLL